MVQKSQTTNHLGLNNLKKVNSGIKFYLPTGERRISEAPTVLLWRVYLHRMLFWLEEQKRCEKTDASRPFIIQLPHSWKHHWKQVDQSIIFSSNRGMLYYILKKNMPSDMHGNTSSKRWDKMMCNMPTGKFCQIWMMWVPHQFWKCMPRSGKIKMTHSM